MSSDKEQTFRDLFPTCTIRDTAIIEENCYLTNAVLDDYVYLKHHAAMNDATIGLRSSLGMYTIANCADIGKYCSISWNTTVGAVDHPISHLSTHAFVWRKRFGLTETEGKLPQERVRIGHDVWIGCNVVVRQGVTIGNGAIIAAGAVVTKDIPPYAIAGGIPARIIRYRWDEKTIDTVNSLQWWDWDDDILKEHIGLFDKDLDSITLEKLISVKKAL